MNYKCLLMTSFLMCCVQLLSAHKLSEKLLQDSLPVVEAMPAYKGNRLAISSIKELKTKGSTIRFKYNLVNTGRNHIVFRKGKAAPQSLVINFDDSLEKNGLGEYKAIIREQLVKQDIRINTGQVLVNNQLKINTQTSSKQPPKKKKKEVLEAEIEEIPNEEIVDAVQENKIEIVPNDKTVATEIEATKVETPKVKPKKKKDKKNSKKKEDDSGTFTIGKSTADDKAAAEDQAAFDRNYCPDLVITDINVLKVTKNWITFEYTILNEGKGPAAFHGPTKVDEDNVGIKAYLSGSEKITRGSLVLGGIFVTKEINSKKGILKAKESFTGKMRLEFRKKTKFTPYLILEVDNFHAVKECDDKNNTKAYFVK